MKDNEEKRTMKSNIAGIIICAIFGGFVGYMIDGKTGAKIGAVLMPAMAVIIEVIIGKIGTYKK